MSFVKIVEVGPRDGLQGETHFVPTEQKIKFIDLLSKTGLSTIEVTSFVSPEKIPQLADNQTVFKGILKKPDIDYPVLVPNIHGLKDAMAANIKTIAVFGAASETFSQKNIHCSLKESLERFKEVIHTAGQHQIKTRGYVSCVLGCPYEGKIAIKAVVDYAKQLYQLGCYEISLGDTIGVGTPDHAKALIAAVSQEIPIEHIAVHFHNTYGQALANIYACLSEGIRIVDASVAGLGGCPYAKGATGNVATEDVLYLLNGLNIKTDVNLDRLLDAATFICNVLKKPYASHVAAALRDPIQS